MDQLYPKKRCIKVDKAPPEKKMDLRKKLLTIEFFSPCQKIPNNVWKLSHKRGPCTLIGIQHYMEHGMVRIEKFSIFFGAVGLEYWLDTVFRISIPYLGQGCFPVMGSLCYRQLLHRWTKASGDPRDLQSACSWSRTAGLLSWPELTQSMACPDP